MKRITSPIATLLALALSSPAVLAQTVTTSPQAATQPTEATEATPGTSDVRIVRLSQARGKVEMDRNTGNGFETAFPNLPVTQGAKLRTGEGVAEVEFEDNSTLRLAPDTVVEFPQLNRIATGATISAVNVLKGTVYVGLAKASQTIANTFTLTCDRGKIVLPPASHIRLDVGSPETSLAVFDGNVQFETASGATDVGKKKALLFSSATQTTPTLVSKIDSGPFDDWDKTQTDFHKRYANANAFAGSPYLYGLADMNYYGAFADLPGCGRVWRPYFASAAWDPYANGVWAWYPGTGYTWVSVYPWGWAPFRYGNWQQCGAGGWGWQPGGRWIGLHEPRQPHNPINPIHHPFPPRPPHQPVPGGSTLVAVNTKPLNFSKFNSATSTFVFHNDSAGLGVPREAFGKLAQASAMTAQHGFVATPVYSGYAGEGNRTGGRGEYNAARSGQANSTASRSSGASTRSSAAASQSRSSVSSSSSYSGGGSHASYSAPASAPSAAASSSSRAAAPAAHH